MHAAFPLIVPALLCFRQREAYKYELNSLILQPYKILEWYVKMKGTDRRRLPIVIKLIISIQTHRICKSMYLNAEYVFYLIRFKKR